jgi:AbrB family looped-hinge helix DNA binding protein
MKTAVSTKGQIVIPSEMRQQDDIEPGQEFEIERIDRGEYRLVRLSPPRNQRLLEWLLACPEKGYFVAIESESTDPLRPRESKIVDRLPEPTAVWPPTEH